MLPASNLNALQLTSLFHYSVNSLVIGIRHRARVKIRS